MAPSAEPFRLDFGPPGPLVTCPRWWRLALGLSLWGAAAALPWLEGLNAWWASATAMDAGLLLGALTLGGVALTLQALFNDQLHVRQIEVHARGLSIRWSHSPRLLGARTEAVRELAWREVVRVEWLEGALEHDLKQRLVMDLREPLSRRQRRLTLLVCDHRNPDRCEALLARLPATVKPPSWLASTRQRRRARATP